MPRIFVILGAISFWLIVCCAMFQLCFLAMAWLTGMLTEPPACEVRSAWPFPYAACPGMSWGPQMQYALALPGAVLALPFIAYKMLANDPGSMQPFALVAISLHVFAWLYALRAVLMRSRRSAHLSQSRRCVPVNSRFQAIPRTANVYERSPCVL